MRKKTLFCFSSIGILVSLALIASSCEREPITPDLLERQINVQINGVLNFDSFEDFSKTAMLLNALLFRNLNNGVMKGHLYHRSIYFRN